MRQCNPYRRYARGFSLVELLTVVAIIVILEGIVIGALTQVKKTQAKKETSVRLQTLKNNLENYVSDNGGIYPVGGDVLSKPLYKALSGDFTGTGEPPEEGATVYWQQLLNKNAGLVKKEGDELVIIDAFNNSFRYRAGVDENGKEVQEARNEDFDAWSLGPDGLPSDLQVDSNLKSEETKDDIWN